MKEDIEKMINDDNVLITKDGDVFIRRSRTIKNKKVLNGSFVYSNIFKNPGQYVVFYNKKMIPVSRVVYSKFVELIDDNVRVIHIDNCSLNNKVENLYANKEQSFNMSRISEEDVLEIRNKGIYDLSLKELSLKYGITKNKIIDIVLGNLFKEYGGIILDKDVLGKLLNKKHGNSGRRSNLTKEDILGMVEMRSKGAKLNDIASAYGVNFTTVSKLLKKHYKAYGSF